MMLDQQARLGFVWPGGGAEHDFYQFLEQTGDRARLYLTCTRVGGDGDNDHDIGALEQTSRTDWLIEAALTTDSAKRRLRVLALHQRQLRARPRTCRRTAARFDRNRWRSGRQHVAGIH